MNIDKLVAPFGLKAIEHKKLDGYVSINYRIKTDNEDFFILKHHKNPLEVEEVIAENKVMEALASQNYFEVPLPITSTKNEIVHRFDDGQFSRVLSYLEGSFLGDEKHTDSLLFSFGEQAGRIDKFLSTINSAVIKSRTLEWDLQHALLNKPLVKFIKNPAQRKLVHYFYDQFNNYVVLKIPSLRKQLIHSDLNDWNILVKNGKVSGFIDFGDMSWSPLINELAIALTYIMMASKTPLEAASSVIKGYVKEYPLLKEEILLLPYLIPTRLCVSVCNSAKAKSASTDTEYILISEKPAWVLLEKWFEWNPIALSNCFLSAAGFDPINMESQKKDIAAKRHTHFSAALGLSFKTPIFMHKAAFQYMYDMDGNTYLDAYNNIPHVGHSHPKISEAVSHQIRQINSNTRYHEHNLTKYATKLLSYFPEKQNKVFFVNSGSEANDLAIRLSKNFTKRNKQLVIEMGYHGITEIGIGISSYKYSGKGGNGKADHIVELPLPKIYRGAFPDTESYVNDAIKTIEHHHQKGDQFSSFICEPISGCGGQVSLAPGYLKALYPFLKKHGIVTIADEVQVGFGRLGDYFWGFEMHEIVPDIVVLGKSMGNGFPVAAVVTTDEIANAFANGMEFFSSFGGNPISTTVANTVLEIIEEEDLQNNAKITGNFFKQKLTELKSKYKCIGDVRGQGLFLGIEFIDPKTDQPGTAITSFVKNKLKENFILSGSDGKYEQVLKFKPPLCFTKENSIKFTDTLSAVLDEYEQEKN